METTGYVSFLPPTNLGRWLDVAEEAAGPTATVTLDLKDRVMRMRVNARKIAVTISSTVNTDRTAMTTASLDWYRAGTLRVQGDAWVNGQNPPAASRASRFPRGQAVAGRRYAESAMEATHLTAIVQGLTESTGIDTLTVTANAGRLRFGGKSAYNINIAEAVVPGTGEAETSVPAAPLYESLKLLKGSTTLSIEDRKSVIRLALSDGVTLVEFDTRIDDVADQPEVTELTDSRRHDVSIKDSDLANALESVFRKRTQDPSTLAQLRLTCADDGSQQLTVDLSTPGSSGTSRRAPTYRRLTLPCTSSDYFEVDMALGQLLGLLAMARHTQGSIVLRSYDPYINLTKVTAYGTSTELGLAITTTCATVGRRPAPANL